MTENLVDSATSFAMDNSQRKITKIAREVAKFAARTLKADGIGTAEFDVLHVIRKNPGITQKEICNTLGLDKGAVAKQIFNMENKGYVIRKSNPTDGRSQLLYATNKANELKNSKAHVEALFYQWLLEDLTAQEMKVFVEALDKIYLKCKNESKSNFTTMSQIVKESEKNGK